jgi:hypothetical protein
MDLPPVVIRSRRAASVPLPLVISPGASGPAMPLPPPALLLPLPCVRPRGCGGSTRGRQAAAPLEPLGLSRAAVRRRSMLAPSVGIRRRDGYSWSVCCCFFFFPIRDRIASPCRSSLHRHRHSRGRGCRCTRTGCSADARDQPPLPVLPPFQVVAPPILPVLVTLALDPSPRLLLYARGHCRPCC